MHKEFAVPKKPDLQPPATSPGEVSALARSVMQRMVHSPPVPHERLGGQGKPKRSGKKRAR